MLFRSRKSTRSGATDPSPITQSSEAEPRMLVVLPPSEPTRQVAASTAVNQPAHTSEDEQASVDQSSESIKHNHQKKKNDGSKVRKQAANGALSTTPKHGAVQMVLVPPLPTVNAESRENPFEDSGIELKPPILLNLIR